MRKLILLYSICIDVIYRLWEFGSIPRTNREIPVHLSGLYRGDNTRHDSTYEFLLYGYLL